MIALLQEAAPTRPPYLDPAFISAITALVVAVIIALGGILVKLFSIAKEANARKVVGDETHRVVNSRFDDMTKRLDAALAVIEARKTADAVAVATGTPPLPAPPMFPPPLDPPILVPPAAPPRHPTAVLPAKLVKIEAEAVTVTEAKAPPVKP